MSVGFPSRAEDRSPGSRWGWGLCTERSCGSSATVWSRRSRLSTVASRTGLPQRDAGGCMSTYQSLLGSPRSVWIGSRWEAHEQQVSASRPGAVSARVQTALRPGDARHRQRAGSCKRPLSVAPCQRALGERGSGAWDGAAGCSADDPHSRCCGCPGHDRGRGRTRGYPGDGARRAHGATHAGTASAQNRTAAVRQSRTFVSHCGHPSSGVARSALTGGRHRWIRRALRKLADR